MIKSRLEALIAYSYLNMPETFNNLLRLYTHTLNLKPLTDHVEQFYVGYAKQSILVNIISIHEQEKEFSNAENFINEFRH